MNCKRYRMINPATRIAGIVILLCSALVLAEDLTPMGSIKGGNADGTIPAWIGDHDKALEVVETLRSEKPIFVIDSSNQETHKSRLSEGQLALLNRYPDSYRIPVYKTYRTHNLPQFIYEGTAKNAESARIAEVNGSISQLWPGIPFPKPEHAVEIIKNHTLHWRGHALKWSLYEAIIHKNGNHSIVESEILIESLFHIPNRPIMHSNETAFHYMTLIKKPAKLSGGGLLTHEPLNASETPRKTWVYQSDQRRVKRLPRFDHDTSLVNTGNLRVVDEIDLFSGSPNKYDWKILGKQELYIPYNATNLAHEMSRDAESILTPQHLSPADQRYELHRVWVIEGTLREGERHIYERRRLYFDEDSYVAIMADIYDKKGALWRTSVSHTRYAPGGFKGIWKVVDAFHDLKTQKYYIQGSQQLSPKHYSLEELKTLPDFSPSSLRREAKK